MARRFNVLGPLEVVIDGVDVTPQAPKERSLLAILVLHRGRVVNADTLIDELWPHLDVGRARRVLWVRIAGLRKCLERAAAAGLLELAAPGYRLHIGADDVDADCFAELVASGRRALDSGDRAGAASTLRYALALWRGDPLADAQGCLLLESEARHLADARLDATEEWIESELACGRHIHVLAALESLVVAHPLRERLSRQRTLALYRCGRPADALTAYRELADRVRDDLGIEPGPELRELERAIIARDPKLVAPWPMRAPWSADAIWERSAPATRRASNLPASPDRFVGRLCERDRLAALLHAHRLVTLAGPAGVGKTRLALEVAEAVVPRPADGVWLVELASVRDADDVPQAACGAFGIVPRPGDRPDDITTLAACYLAQREALLVLDNAEHLIDAVARLVHVVLTRCESVTVLVTSRELLHIPGEAVFDLPPLSLPASEQAGLSDLARSDAMMLFAERARAASLSFTLSPATAPAVAQVCRQLDGIPLAIELAAARVRVLSVQQIADRLDDRFRLLVDETRAVVPERHRTLRAAVDWSHDLLTDAEQAALRRLAVFPGRFGLDAAVAVIERTQPTATGEVLDGFSLVSRLVDKSLLVVEAGDDIRFRLLDSIRHYAAEKLDAAGEVVAAHGCHRDVFVERCGPLWPLMTAQERLQGLADQDNLRAALEWAWHERDIAGALRLTAYLATSWLLVGAQDMAWLERVLEASRSVVNPARVRVMVDLVVALEDTSVPATGPLQELLEASAELASQIDDPVESAACALTRAETYLTWGQVERARSLATSSLHTYERLGATLGIGWCHHSLGWIAVADSDVATARSEFEQALECSRSPGGEWALPHVLAALAPLVALTGDHVGGVVRAEQAIAAARAFGSPPVLAMALERAIETRIIADGPAIPDLVELLQLLLDLGTRRWAADALEMSAVVLARHGAAHDAAIAMEAAEILRQVSKERAGGIRAVAAEVGRTNEHLLRSLPPEDLAQAAAQAHRLSAEQAMAEVVHALTEQPADERP